MLQRKTEILNQKIFDLISLGNEHFILIIVDLEREILRSVVDLEREIIRSVVDLKEIFYAASLI